jgi:hypothetical protein
MKNDEKPKVLAVETTRALTRHLDERAVAIIATVGHFDLGSGVCISIGGRYFVATAAHVVSEYQTAELFLVTQRERQTERVPICGRGHRGGGKDDPLDIAWLEIEPADAKSLKREFVPGERLRCGCSELPNDFAFVYGFPTQLAVPTLKDNVHAVHLQPIGRGTATLDGTDRPDVGSVDVDIFLEYRGVGTFDVDGASVAPRTPLGLSGGEIWAVELNTNDLWTVESARLIAIDHSWLKWKWIRGTQIQHWLLMLKEDNPDLAEAIDPLLQRQ